MADKRIKGITIEIGGDTTKLDKALSGVNKTLRDSQSELKDINKLLKLDPGNTDLLKQKYEALTKSVDATKEKLQTLKTAQEQAAQALAKGEITQSQYDNLQREIIETEQSLKSLTDQYKEFGTVAGQQISVAGDKMQEVGGKITDAGKKMSVVSAGVAGVGAATIAAAKELDSGYDIIITKTGATGENFEKLKEVADQVFADLPTDMDTVGTAIGEVNTRFGLTGDKLKEVSEEFIKFAEINGTDINGAIDSVDSIMTKFQVDTSQTGNVLGLFTKISQDTGITIETLEGSLEKNGAALKEMGFGLTESVNLLGMMESSGVDTSTAMAGLKKAVVEAAKDGKSADEALTETIESIKNAKSETEALSIATELFGSKGAAEMSQAIRENRLDINDLSGSLQDYGTVVADTFEATQDPWDKATTAMNQIKLAGAELGSTLLTTLAPMIESVMEKVKSATEWFSNLSEGQKKLIVTIGLVVAAIGPVVTVIGSIVSAVGAVMGVVGPIISVVGPALTAVIGAISAPVLAVVAAIAAAIAIGVALYKNWDTIKEKAGEMKEAVAQKWEETKEAIKNKWNEAKEAVANSKIGEVAGNVLEAAKSTVKEKLDAIKQAYDENGGGVKGVVAASVEAIKGYYTAGLTFIDNLTGGKLTELKDKFTEKFNAIKDGVKAALDFIKEKFDGLKLKLPEIKLPHFKISGSFSLNPPSVPSIGIDWYKKAMQGGMILNSPTIFGAAGGKLLGAGEAGPEAVVGVGSLQSMIQDAVGTTGINTMVSLMQQYLPYLAESTEIRLDSGALVGATAHQMNSALGQISAREARR